MTLCAPGTATAPDSDVFGCTVIAAGARMRRLRTRPSEV